jgi:phytanoyl-CoA hydroxylase
MPAIGSTVVGALPGTYERDGAVVVRSVFSAAEMDRVRHRFMDEVDRGTSLGWDDGVPPEDPLARYPRFVHPHRRPDTAAGRLAREIMLDPRLFRIVTELIGPAWAAQSMFYFKPPSARGQAMHQDNRYLLAHPETCLAAWIAVDDTDRGNGGLYVVPGSHRLGLLCPEPTDDDTSFTNDVIRLPAGMEPVQVDLAAGDALFFHGSLAHGSPPNTSTDRFRRSLIFHYVPAMSTEIARFHQPLLTSDGGEIRIDDAHGGGPCGDTSPADGP